MNLEQLLNPSLWEPTEESEKALNKNEGFRAVSAEARKALQKEILPNYNPGSPVNSFVEQTATALREALEKKDTLYTRLVRWKAIDQTDASYIDDLVWLLHQWAGRVENHNPEPAPAPDWSESATSMSQALGPAGPGSSWRLANTLNEVFNALNVEAKAQAVPLSGSLKKASGAMVTVNLGSGLSQEQVNLYHRPLHGWVNPTHDTPRKMAEALLQRLASL